jgi:hypothetical protein
MWSRFVRFIASRKSFWASDLFLSVVVSVGFFLLLLTTSDIPGGDDAYRHVKYAFLLIRNPRVTLSDPWKLLYFWPKPMDAWFGFHLLLAPLTLLLGLITSAKVLAAAVFGALAFVLLDFMKYLGVFCRKIWVVFAIAGSGIVLYRATIARPFLLSVVLVVIVTHYTLRNNAWGVSIASAAHALCYSMFFVAAFAPGIYLILRRDKKALKLLAASLAGLVVGLICNPTWPQNFRFEVVDLYSTLMLGLRLTKELEPLTMEWIGPSWVVMALWLCALISAAWLCRKQRLSEGVQLLLAMTLVAFAVSIRVGRMFDYFVPLAILCSAAVLSPRIVKTARTRTDAAAVATFLFLVCGMNVFRVYQALDGVPIANRYEGASEYLLRNGHGAIVFNTQWEQYPFLYFWNSQNTYVTGIEPAVMFIRDSRRYWLWRHIANDEPVTCGNPVCTSENSTDIDSTFSEFGAAFVFIDHKNNPKLDQNLGRMADATEVYHDSNCSVFSIRGRTATLVSPNLPVPRLSTSEPQLATAPRIAPD